MMYPKRSESTGLITKEPGRYIRALPQSRFRLPDQTACRTIPVMGRTKLAIMVVIMVAIAVDGLMSKPGQAMHEMSRGRAIEAIILLIALFAIAVTDGVRKR